MPNKKNKDKVIALYAITGVKGKSAIKIKHLETGKLGQNQRIKDTSIHKYQINSYIAAEVFQCNITDSHLVSTKKQPMLYVTIAMVKPLKLCVLCNLMIYFTIEDEIKSKEQFLNSQLAGKFSIELFRDGIFKQLDKEIGVFPGNEKMLNMIEEMTKNEAMVQVLKELADIEEAKIGEKYKDELNYFTIPKNSISLKNYKLNNEYDDYTNDSPENRNETYEL